MAGGEEVDRAGNPGQPLEDLLLEVRPLSPLSRSHLNLDARSHRRVLSITGIAAVHACPLESSSFRRLWPCGWVLSQAADNTLTTNKNGDEDDQDDGKDNELEESSDNEDLDDLLLKDIDRTLVYSADDAKHLMQLDEVRR